jgi:S1-C subfamily serine protease
MPGDKIVKIGDKGVSSVNQARVLISQSLPGSSITIEVFRQGLPKKLQVVLGSMSEENEPIPGIELSPITPVRRKEFNIPDSIRGVVVSDSTGETETFKKGVVLVEVNGSQILSVDDVTQNLYSGINRFYVWYRGKYRFLAYRIR